ncbi:hypothetical protein [Candidatus Halobonum tyrrellensis]|uniref:hypothetical protein n=1 Tax=Candidatus Halobonum tyrrellensis TaxID=1431545 RepID=UPI000677D569|nr:hypothetical protein [Candidatus Halobonum tyrrellensis]
MSSALTDLGFAREEYTGENRCWPCTALNLLLLAVGCALLSLLSPLVGVAAAVVGCGAVWLRGYLLPYTPRVGPRLAARLPGDPFHVGPAVAADGVGGGPPDGTDSIADAGGDGEAVLASLVERGVVRPDGDDLRLDDRFERRWDAETETLRAASLDDLAAATLDATPAASHVDTFERRDRRYVILSDGSDDPGAESWLRRPVAVSETAAARALADFGVDPADRPVAAHSLGLFLTDCPACGGEVTEGLAGDCCGPPPTDAAGDPLEALVCADCGVELHLFE